MLYALKNSYNTVQRLFLLLTAIYSQMRNFSQLLLRLDFENTIF